MSKLMKDARDIRLLGIGLVIGLVIWYVLNFDEPSPAAKPMVTMTLAQTTPPAAPSQTVFPTGESYIRHIDLFEPREEKGRMRIVPARNMDGQFPGGPAEYDLIDLNYKPDFKLPAD